MIRERALKVVLVIVGLFFTAGIYPLTMILWFADRSRYAYAMMLSLDVTLGILLLLAVRNPSEHRSLIAFAAWSSVAHATVMAIQAYQTPRDHDGLLALAILIVIGVLLLVLAPAKQSVERASAGDS